MAVLGEQDLKEELKVSIREEVKQIHYFFLKLINISSARQFEERMSECSSCSPAQSQGAVCGTDGKTYNSECKLKQAGCSNVRRQGNY